MLVVLLLLNICSLRVILRELYDKYLAKFFPLSNYFIFEHRKLSPGDKFGESGESGG